MPTPDSLIVYEWCKSVHVKFIELEKSLQRYKFQSARHDGDLKKVTRIFSSNIQNIREQVSEIIWLINAIQTAIMCREISHDYRKYSEEEVKYFSYEWQNKYIPLVKKILDKEVIIDKQIEKEEGKKDESITFEALNKLQQSIEENEKLMRYITYSVEQTKQATENIRDHAEKSCKFITSGRKRLRRVAKWHKVSKFMRRLTFGISSLCLLSIFLIVILIIRIFIF